MVGGSTLAGSWGGASCVRVRVVGGFGCVVIVIAVRFILVFMVIVILVIVFIINFRTARGARGGCIRVIFGILFD